MEGRVGNRSSRNNFDENMGGHETSMRELLVQVFCGMWGQARRGQRFGAAETHEGHDGNMTAHNRTTLDS